MMPLSGDATGLLLPGGGARAAYQVGALRAIAKLLPRDIDRLVRIAHANGDAGLAVANIDVFVLFPSRDLGAFALRYADRLPRGVHYLLRGHGSTRGTGANLLSYLLFDREFARALIRLGHDDAMARRDELVDFLDGASPGYVPLFPRELH